MRKICLFGMLLAMMFWAVGGAVAAPKGKVVIGLAGGVSTFDPHRLTSFPLGQQYPLVFDTLVSRDYAGKIIPHLAKSFRYIKPNVIEFKIREGVKFTNGEPVDAHAVKFSLERIMDPKLKSRQFGYFRTIDHVEVVDRYTARLHLKFADSFVIGPLTQYGAIVPPKYYKSHDLTYLARHPVGSGPYKLVSWKKGEELVYEANPGYWDPSKQAFKTGVIKVIPEPTTRVAALVAGDLDIVNAIPPQLARMVKGNPKVELVSGRSPKTCYIIMIIKPGSPWEKVKVRKALNYAVDKLSIIKNILQGHARIVATNVGPTSYGHNPDLKPFPYKPDLAKKLLAEAGYPNGFKVDMYVPLGRYLMGKQGSEAIAGQLAKVGVKVRVRAVEWGKLSKLSGTRWEPHVKPFWWYSCRNDTNLHAEGMYAGTIHSKALHGGFIDKEVDKLIDDARSEPDDAKRVAKYREISRLLREKYVPLVFLYQLDQITGKKKSLNWKMRSSGYVLLSDISGK